MNRIQLGKIHVDPCTREGAIARILQLAADDRPHLVVTPNIAHVYQSRSSHVLRQAYQQASFAPPDGWPVVEVARVLGDHSVPVERVAGSDLMIDLCMRPVSIAIVGGAGNSAEKAARRLSQQNPGLRVVSVEPAPRSEITDPDDLRRLVGRIAAAGPDLVFVGLGVPRQETVALELLGRLDRGVIMCIGASIEFAAGTLKRAPRSMQSLKMEWLYRLAREPRKLAVRYLVSAPYFLATVAMQYRHTGRQSSGRDTRSAGNRPPAGIDRLIVHQFDPARPSPGGIDTCLRGICKYFPAVQPIAIIGVDTGLGPAERALGVWEKHTFNDRTVWFLPVVRLDPANQKRVVPHSLRLIAGVLRYRRSIPDSRHVQAHRMDTGLSLLALLRKRPLHYFVHTQESGLTGSSSDSVWKYASRIHSALEKVVAERALKVVVFNPQYATTMSRWNENTQFSPTWYDPELVREHADIGDKFRILWVGRVEEPKDPLLAIAAYRRLLALDPANPWTLDVLGDGTLMESLQAEVHRSGVGDGVRLHGRVAPEGVANLMARSRVFLMTSQPGYEGYPRVLVEAMASGCVPVVTDGSDTGGLIVNGGNGFVADSRAPDEIASLIMKSFDCSGEAAIQTVSRLRAPSVIESLFQSESIRA
ncbi:WecB/TagA/CpsF family glycosyltransferase [Rhodococcus ruber]|uniref:WecB/TagA/CpsF family glycosyltransferase n=1 Tax=Rhodococcus ruber TaxID=1830 RepID=UPI0037851CFB